MSVTPSRELAGHAAARVLRDAGVPWVAGVAGESFLPLLDGLRVEGIPYLSVAHESGAAFLGSAFGRATGRAALVAVTRGPGASNALIGVHEAAQANAPLVLLVGQIESAIRGRRALQEMEFDRVFGSVAKAVFEVTRGDQVAPSLLAAIRKAELGRPGPVVVSVPADLFFEDVPVTRPVLERPSARADSLLAPESLAEIAALVENAQRGLFVVGRAFAGGALAPELERLAEATGFGIVGGHAFPDVMRTEHEHWLGCSTIRGPLALKEALRQADVIVLLDHWLGDRVTQGYLPVGARLAAVTHDADIGWDEYLHARIYAASAVQAVAQITAAAIARPGRRDARRAWTASSRSSVVREAEATLAASENVARGTVPYGRIVAAIDRALPDEATVVSDAGSFNDWFVRYLPYRAGRRYVGPLSGAMGFAIPGAIGAHLARPSARTVALTGDGGFLMTAMEISTAARLGLPVATVVFSNGIWGSIALHQDRSFPGRRFGIDLPDISCAQVATSLGAKAFTVRDPAELEPALRAAFGHPGPSLVEVATDGRFPAPSSFAAERS